MGDEIGGGSCGRGQEPWPGYVAGLCEKAVLMALVLVEVSPEESLLACNASAGHRGGRTVEVEEVAVWLPRDVCGVIGIGAGAVDRKTRARIPVVALGSLGVVACHRCGGPRNLWSLAQ